MGGHRAGCCQHRGVVFWCDLYPFFLKKNPALFITGYPSCISLRFITHRAAPGWCWCPRQCPGVHSRDSLHLVSFSPCSCHSIWPSLKKKQPNKQTKTPKQNHLVLILSRRKKIKSLILTKPQFVTKRSKCSSTFSACPGQRYQGAFFIFPFPSKTPVCHLKYK